MSKQNEQKIIQTIIIKNEGKMMGVGFLQADGKALSWDDLTRTENELMPVRCIAYQR